MKLVFKFLSLFFIVWVLHACEIVEQPIKETNQTQGGNSLFDENRTRAIQQPSDATEINLSSVATENQNDEISQLMISIAEHFQELNAVELIVDTEFQSDGFTFLRSQNGQENYSDGALNDYLINIESEVGETQANESYYYDRQKYHNQFQSQEWLSSDYENRSPIKYLSLVKILIEGSAEWNIQEDNNQTLISFIIENQEILNDLFYYLDYPFMLSPSAESRASVDYTVNPDNGSIINAQINVQVDDLGQNFVITSTATPWVSFEPFTFDVDVSEASIVKTESEVFADYFKYANPTESIFYYDTLLSIQSGDQIDQTIILNNTLANQLYMALSAPIRENQYGELDLQYKNETFNNQSDEDTASNSIRVDEYAKYVNLAIRDFEELQLIEEDSTDQTSNNSYTLRAFYENYQEFAEVNSPLDTQFLSKEAEEVIYAVDYIIDKDTQQLKEVYLWSALANAESVTELMILTFTNFNANNPNYVLTNIDETIWEEVQSTQ